MIVAALSMQDPRERPTEQQELADQKHRRFADPTSDFAGILNLWRYLKEQQKELSSSAFRRHVQGRLPQLPAGARVAGPRRAAAAGQQAARLRGDQGAAAAASRSTSRCSPACCPTSG